MDTYVHPRVWGYRRSDFIETKELFINRSKMLAEGGREVLMKDLLSSLSDSPEPRPPAPAKG
jgi:hypothetical protein